MRGARRGLEVVADHARRRPDISRIGAWLRAHPDIHLHADQRLGRKPDATIVASRQMSVVVDGWEPRDEETSLGKCFEAIHPLGIDGRSLVAAAVGVDQVLDGLVVVEHGGLFRRREECREIDRCKRFDVGCRYEIDRPARDGQAVGLHDPTYQAEDFGLDAHSGRLRRFFGLAWRPLRALSPNVLLARVGEDQRYEHQSEDQGPQAIHAAIINDSGRRFKCRSVRNHLASILVG